MGVRHILAIEGVIEAGDSARIENMLQRNRITMTGSIFTVNSPGGNLDEGLAIARVIRAHGGDTEVDGPTDETGHSAPSICMSACTFLFLGGVHRYVPSNARYGVHRWFYATEGLADRNEATAEAQQESGKLVAFVQEMVRTQD